MANEELQDKSENEELGGNSENEELGCKSENEELQDKSEKKDIVLDEMDVPGCMGKYQNWLEELKLDKSGVIQFEAKCKDDFYVGFSTECNGSKKVAEIAGGAHGNTEAVLYIGKNVVQTTFCGRICSCKEYVPYWILVSEKFICMGTGDVVGKRVLIKYELESSLEIEYFAFSSWASPVFYKNVKVNEKVDVEIQDIDTVVWSSPNGKDLVSEEDRSKFNVECDRARKRAERFGGKYKPPSIKTCMPSQEVRRMQRMGAVDMEESVDEPTPEEVRKRLDRSNRFGTTENVPNQENMDFSAEAIVLQDRVDYDDLQNQRKEALHMYTLDKKFKLVRTSDILQYFHKYNPAYVEWINDSSCTVVFRNTAQCDLALQNKAAKVSDTENFKLKHFPDTTEAKKVPEYQDTGISVHEGRWRYAAGITPRKIPNKSYRILLRPATSKDFPPEKLLKDSQKRKGHFKGHYDSPRHQRHRRH